MAPLRGRDERFRTHCRRHENWRRGFLQRPRQNPDVVRAIKPPFVGEGRLAPRALDNLQAFVEALAAFVHRLVEAVVSRLDKATADSQIQASPARAD